MVLLIFSYAVLLLQSLEIDKESAAEIWRKKNQSKDPFLQFLKDADSL